LALGLLLLLFYRHVVTYSHVKTSETSHSNIKNGNETRFRNSIRAALFGSARCTPATAFVPPTFLANHNAHCRIIPVDIQRVTACDVREWTWPLAGRECVFSTLRDFVKPLRRFTFNRVRTRSYEESTDKMTDGFTRILNLRHRRK